NLTRRVTECQDEFGRRRDAPAFEDPARWSVVDNLTFIVLHERATRPSGAGGAWHVPRGCQARARHRTPSIALPHAVNRAAARRRIPLPQEALRCRHCSIVIASVSRASSA